MKTLLACFCVLASCGDDGGNQLADAPLAGDATDASADTPVTLTVTYDGQPAANVDVYFVNPDASLVAKVPTNASGVASAVVIAGGSVTAVDPYPSNPGVAGPIGVHRELKTFAGVQPGDQLRLTRDDRRGNADLTVTVNAPSDGAADGYAVYTSCSFGDRLAGSPPTGPTLLTKCANGMADVLVVSLTQEVETGYIYKANVAVADQAILDLTAETYLPVPRTSHTFSNIPSPFTDLYFQTALYSTKGRVWRSQFGPPVTAGMVTQAFPRPSLPDTVAVVRTSMNTSTTNHEAYLWGPPATTTYDLGAPLLHEYTAPAVTALPAHTITWTASGGLTPDLTTALLFVSDETRTHSYRWEIAAPYAGASVTYPTLPAEALPFAAVSTDRSFVELITAKVPGGYDAVRAGVLSLESPFELVAGATGTISLAHYSDPSKQARQAPPARTHGWAAPPRR